MGQQAFSINLPKANSSISQRARASVVLYCEQHEKTRPETLNEVKNHGASYQGKNIADGFQC